jgi:1-deoxy-D-xylulose-5-phosphate synthase
MKEYKYLSRINNPSDLRLLDENDLPSLCGEIRSYMIDVVTRVGGHLGASLGVVELTVALHYVFDTPIDKIIFDVGHQSYPHKILTERKTLLPTIRQKGGISGFMKPAESEYDAFITGHASNSISAALGIAVANDLNKKLHPNTPNIHSIAVIGDGAMTGGLAYEALNNAGVLGTNLLVILNDNNISIDKNVSAFSHYFNEIFSSHKVQYLKDNIWKQLERTGSKGDRVRRFASRVEGSVKSIITPGMLFEAMGFNYFGPINGNNINKVIKILRNIKSLSGPIFLHVVTEKGKGYELAENDSRKLHAIGKIDKYTGLSLKTTPSNIKYQDVFGNVMLDLFAEDEKLVAISAAMFEGTGLTEVAEKYPSRVFDVGIAEAHSVTFAAGLSSQGIIPIVAIYSSFLQRAFDSIIHDCALQKLHIIFAIDRAGIVGEDGATHHGVFDIAYLRIIPNIILLAPKDGAELRNMLYSAIYDYDGCVAIRYPRGEVPETEVIDKNEYQHIQLGKSETLVKGKNICVIALGKMVDVALQAQSLLTNKNISIEVINARFVKPLDTEMLDDVALRFNHIITIEDGQKCGGFGSAVLEYFAFKNYANNLIPLGISDRFVEHGAIDLLLSDEGLDVDTLVKVCEGVME